MNLVLKPNLFGSQNMKGRPASASATVTTARRIPSEQNAAPQISLTSETQMIETGASEADQSATAPLGMMPSPPIKPVLINFI